jgi:origin recognition complex subunit 1
MARINFHPYNSQQLQKIVHARLDSAKEGLSSHVFEQDAIKFSAMKVSSISGDARRILDVCRYAVLTLRTRSCVLSTMKTGSRAHSLH